MFRYCLLIIFIYVVTTSCSSSEEQSDEQVVNYDDCGCGSEPYRIIPDQSVNVPLDLQISGKLYYKSSQDVDRYHNFPEGNNRYWILQQFPGCGNCDKKFFVCNEDLLNLEMVNATKVNRDTIDVTISGSIMRGCNIFITPADLEYGEIHLININI
ncbi:MAG: hypothetical protein WBA16_02830 [Nonlabens sp.]